MTGGALPAVSETAVGVAMIRAAERERQDPLFDDRLAQAFVAASGWSPPGAADPERQARAASLVTWITVRTKFLDDLVRDACAHGCRQVVLLAAGLDARAFRLGLAPDVHLFELDLPELLTFKARVIDADGALPSCRRVVVPTDLTGSWPDDLLAAGFDRTVPTVWLAEGLLVYLTREQNEKLVDDITALAAPGSRLGLTLSGRAESADRRGDAEPVFDHERLWQSASPGDADGWLGPRGWSVTVHGADERATAYDRPFPGDLAARRSSRLVGATRAR